MNQTAGCQEIIIFCGFAASTSAHLTCCNIKKRRHRCCRRGLAATSASNVLSASLPTISESLLSASTPSPKPQPLVTLYHHQLYPTIKTHTKSGEKAV
jgi:hypothetical protein